jgi:heme exporter protein A
MTLVDLMMDSPIPLLELKAFSIARDERRLFADLQLTLHAGEIIQLLGPNGAGKTSLLRVIAGVSNDYEGELLYLNEPMPKVRWEFACDLLYLPHAPGIKKAMTPRENLQWYMHQSAMQGDIDDALDKVGLAGFEDVLAGSLSAGQLRRVALARLYLSKARVWILDEPFTAIDKKGVSNLEAIMREHAAAGGAVLLTSHQDLSFDELGVVDLADYRVIENEMGWAEDCRE